MLEVVVVVAVVVFVVFVGYLAWCSCTQVGVFLGLNTVAAVGYIVVARVHL